MAYQLAKFTSLVKLNGDQLEIHEAFKEIQEALLNEHQDHHT